MKISVLVLLDSPVRLRAAGSPRFRKCRVNLRAAGGAADRGVHALLDDELLRDVLVLRRHLRNHGERVSATKTHLNTAKQVFSRVSSAL